MLSKLINNLKEYEVDLKSLLVKEEKLLKLTQKSKKVTENIENLTKQINNTQIKQNILYQLNHLKKIEKTFTKNLKNGEIDFLFDKFLKEDAFLDILKTTDGEYFYIFALLNRQKEFNQIIANFLQSKLDLIFTVKNNIFIGIIFKKDIQILSKLNHTNFIDPITNQFVEIEFFNMAFEFEGTANEYIYKCIDIFEKFTLKPSLSEENFIFYSLIENKIKTLPTKKVIKKKENFDFIYDMSYPEIENEIRKQQKNIAYIFAILDRIDNEIDEINSSRGTINVVKRILSFIKRVIPDKDIQRLVQLIYQNLKG